MSRVGNRAILVPEGVLVNVNEKKVELSGPGGSLERSLPSGISVKVNEAKIFVRRSGESRELRRLHGLYRALISNMVTGVHKGFEKAVELRGIGYKAQLKDKKLMFNLGYSNAIELEVPEGVGVEIVKKPMVEQLAVTQVVFRGIDKELLGRFAAKIRTLRPPEPYKGKGVRNVGEYVRRKAGKKAA